ncbi:hypothetical protein C7H19_08980 [Aphanothece hegewaldii CCALA 016]|uniref:Uncharacterized protein n=1 Tax=Aphanothece hegewaldii CCALA 016 TaxID=2107694 RepID=A0A2T1LZ76_9CHRO|nr:hypothetical protein [Aphanothece hegewaldii]PSF37678.1 hypothetical protein C7H19_08980 [Aphanothece hegewaldii CCALA 016]
MEILSILGLISTFSLLGLVGWTLGSVVKDTIEVAKTMHEIPCANCQYFTDDHRLKCTLHPKTANTEQAIDCSDYRVYNRFYS